MDNLENKKSTAFTTSSSKDLLATADFKTVYFTNQNQYLTLRRWYYSGGNWQNKNCPVGLTCNNPDIKVCHQNPATAIDIGSMPCGVTVTLYAVFFDSRTNQERQFEIRDTSADCSKVAKYIHLAPEH